MARINAPAAAPTIGLAVAMTTLGAIPVFLVSSQAVLIWRDIGFAEARFGLAVSCFFAAAAGVAFVGGRIADKLGRRRSTMVAGAISALGSACLAWGTHSYATLLVALVILGFANASLQLTSNISLATSIPLHRQGLAFGMKQSAIPLAIFLAGLAVPAIGVAVGWRWTFVVTGIFGLGILASGLSLPNDTAQHKILQGSPDRAPFRALVLSAAAMALASAAVNSLGAFLAAWGYEIGMTPSHTGYLLAAGSALSIVGRVVTGHRADVRGGRNLPVVAVQMVAGALALAFVSVGSVETLWPAAILAFAVGWAWPGLMLFAIVRVGRDLPGAATGVIQAGAFVGGASGPALFGMLVTYTNYPVAWRIAALCMLVAAGLVMVARVMFVRDLVRRPIRPAEGAF
jgi:MFS family permease